MNVNMISCAGQATIPIVNAVSRIQSVAYAEIVASLASKSVGPGTRANLDEFTYTTSGAIEKVGGARKGKALAIINPAEPPMIMRNTISCLTDDEPDHVQDHRVHPADDQGGAEVRAGLPPGEWPDLRRQQGAGVHGGGRPGRLPAALRRQPGHHDRRRRPHRRDVRRGNPGRAHPAQRSGDRSA
jgi:hypothetical protein